MRYQDRHIVLTGGTRGLGRAMTLAYLTEGAHVHATYAGNEAAAEELRELAGENSSACISTVRRLRPRGVPELLERHGAHPGHRADQQRGPAARQPAGHQGTRPNGSG
ncbi:MAG: SDR family NAD(P)-dependent oxidoreductase [Planctomycetota bacterium]